MSAPQITQALDDVGPQTGSVYYGGYTNDTAPVVEVQLATGAQVGDVVSVGQSGASGGAAVTVTANDLTQGFVHVQLSGLVDGWNLLTATERSADGLTAQTSASFALGVSTATPATPTLVCVADDAGAKTGSVSDGGHTDDATLTFTLHEAGLPDPPTGSPGHAPYGGPALLSGTMQLYDGSNLVGTAQIGYGGQVTITTAALSPGDHTLTAVAVDRAGDASAPSAAFHVTIGADSIDSGSGSTGASDAGGETLHATTMQFVVEGGDGNDTIAGTDGFNYLRGGAGDDSISGGGGFDDLNGNTGNDTLSGGNGDDWVVGGKDNDLLNGDGGTDIVFGNLGNDTCNGGDGWDLIRGGQGDDSLSGGAGDDWLSGDRGDDTVSGGAGADIFHSFAGAGIDRITDFNQAEGDRIQLDAGSTYHLSQVGADAVLTFDGGGEVILAGVQASSLTGNWIFTL